MNRTIVEAYLKKLKDLSCQKREEIEHWFYRIADYISPDNYVLCSEWMPLTGSERLPANKTIFFETTYTFPKSILNDDDVKDDLFIQFNHGEGILKIDGETYHGIDQNRSRIPLRPEWAGQKKTLTIEFFDLGNQNNQEGILLLYCHLGRVYKKIEKYYFDLKLAWDTYHADHDILKKMTNNLEAAQKVIQHSSAEYIKTKLDRAITQSLLYLDIHLTGEKLLSAIEKADEILMQEISAIDDGNQKGHLSLIGHTHIDVAWLWQLKDTVRKCGHTFSNMVRLMEEYPEFTFSCSQPQLYAYTKQYYPNIYEQIKKYVREGRWDIVGPMWVESDCNLISGESLVRQILYGRKFFLKEFGKSTDICWLPDTFGFQANMPQILKKAGVLSFFSYKLHWQAQNRFPYGSFIWKGIDGSEVLASVPELYSGYNGKPCPAEIKYAQDENLQKEYLDDVIFTYGWGDGGGGPTYEMIEYIKRLDDYPGLPTCTLSKAEDFFLRIKEKEEILPVWYGELYLETHRGTLTSQGFAKKMNRRAENLYQQIEKLSIMTKASDETVKWEKLEEGWEKILLLQFHDILPGSSIAEVYKDANEIYSEIMNIGEQTLNNIFNFTEKQNKQTIVTVANTLSWNRSEVVSFAAEELLQKMGKQMGLLTLQVETVEGEPVLSEIEIEKDSEGNLVEKIYFYAENIPSMGFKTFLIKEGEKAISKETSQIETKASSILIQTPYYKMELDYDGRILRLYDQEKERMVITQPANDFEIFLDGPQKEDAWNIYECYKKRKLNYLWDTDLFVAENNSIRTVIRIKKASELLTIDQDLILYSKNRRIDFNTVIDWKERNKVLKVAFPVAVHTPFAAYEVGFGTLYRPTMRNNPYEKAKFEVCAHKWVDLSEGEYGVSLLNDCKYGHDAEGNKLSLTLLRGPTSPDPTADLGVHHMTYSLYPHEGDWREALTARRGHELNHSMFVICGHPDLADYPAFLQIDNPNLIVDTVKRAEDGNGVIIRLYECNGNRGAAQMTVRSDIEKVMETNLIEENMHSVETREKQILFEFGPYEIKTFRVLFQDHSMG